MLTLALLAASLSQQVEAQRAAERIQQAQRASMMLIRAQHREIERAQPISHLTPAEVAANRKAELDRLVMPGGLR